MKIVRHFPIWRPTLKCIMVTPLYNIGFWILIFAKLTTTTKYWGKPNPPPPPPLDKYQAKELV